MASTKYAGSLLIAATLAVSLPQAAIAHTNSHHHTTSTTSTSTTTSTSKPTSKTTTSDKPMAKDDKAAACCLMLTRYDRESLFTARAKAEAALLASTKLQALFVQRDLHALQRHQQIVAYNQALASAETLVPVVTSYRTKDTAVSYASKVQSDFDKALAASDATERADELQLRLSLEQVLVSSKQATAYQSRFISDIVSPKANQLGLSAKDQTSLTKDLQFIATNSNKLAVSVDNAMWSKKLSNADMRAVVTQLGQVNQNLAALDDNYLALSKNQPLLYTKAPVTLSATVAPSAKSPKATAASGKSFASFVSGVAGVFKSNAKFFSLGN